MEYVNEAWEIIGKQYDKSEEEAKSIFQAGLKACAISFRVGGIYFSTGQLFKIDGIMGVEGKISYGGQSLYVGETDLEFEERYSIKPNLVFNEKSWFRENARHATDEEIKLFKRAEMYHKHGRKLDELRVDDFVRSGNDIYQITQTEGFVQSIIDGKHELYLTLEEAQEAHKKIVGE